MSTDEQSLASILAELKDRAGVNPQRGNNNVAITNIEQVSKFLGFKLRAISSLARGPNYYVQHINKLLNPYFASDLTSWTEVNNMGIDFPITFPANWGSATTARSTAVDTYDIARLSMSSLGISLTDTANTYTGEIYRYQDVAASVGQVWSFDIRCLPTILTNANMIVRVEWLDGGGAILSTVSETVASASSSAWTATGATLINITAPASTATMRLSLVLSLTSGVGTVYFDSCFGILNSSIRGWVERGIVGYSAVN